MKRHQLRLIIGVVSIIIAWNYIGLALAIAGDNKSESASTSGELIEYFPDNQIIQRLSGRNQAPAAYGTFDFNDGTTQGWSVIGPYDEDGDGPFSSCFARHWDDNHNYPSPGGTDPQNDNHGSYQICTASSHCITNPGATYWYMYYLSPDLSSSPRWQSAGGFTVEILNWLEKTAPFKEDRLKLYFTLHVTVYDQDQGKNRYFRSSAEEIFNVYQSGSQEWVSESLGFTGTIAGISNKTIKDIMVSFRGEMKYTYIEGGVYLDEIIPIQNKEEPKLSLNVSSLDFGTSTDKKFFSISNGGTGTLTWSVAENPNETWITSISPTSGSNNDTITVKVDRSKLSSSIASGKITVTSNGGNKNITVNIAKPEEVDKPATPVGPSTGKVVQELEFSTDRTTSSLGNELEYQFDWGDGSQSSWGSTAQSHSYSEEGEKEVKVRSRCKENSTIVSYWSPRKSVNISWCNLTLAMNPTDAGTILRNPAKTNYAYNEAILLKVNVDEGYLFDHWNGDLSGTENPTSIMMAGDKTVTAYVTPANTSVASSNESIPEQFQLHQNYPNPFNPETSIAFDLPAMSDVSLRVYDLQGRLIRTIAHGRYKPGHYNIVWNGQNLSGEAVPSGVYVYQIITSEFTSCKKMILLK